MKNKLSWDVSKISVFQKRVVKLEKLHASEEEKSD